MLYKCKDFLSKLKFILHVMLNIFYNYKITLQYSVYQ